jgi:NADPH:quinone reductase-like Zn-dependent oxidoreductase
MESIRREQSMTHAIRIYENGGPEAMQWEAYEPGEPLEGEVLVRHKAIGASVIGTAGSPEKAEKARANGCHYPILYEEKDFAAEVRNITDGRGVDVVYDSVGQATFMKSRKVEITKTTMAFDVGCWTFNVRCSNKKFIRHGLHGFYASMITTLRCNLL